MRSCERLYNAVPAEHGGVRLVPRIPIIRTLDAASSRRTRTKDDLLTGPTPEKRISRGLVWDGSLTPPHHDEFTEAVEELGEGTFAAGRVLHPQDLEAAISLGRQWIGELETLRDKAAEVMAGASDERHDLGPAADKPPGTTDSVSPRGSSLFSAQRTADYATALKTGRETQAVTAPQRVRTAADYNASLKAGRAAKA